jgi:NTE family protein
MNHWFHLLRSKKIGLALSGGAVRGLAHIGVIKVLAQTEIQPDIIAGVNAGSIVGAGLAAGMDWRELAAMARSVFWPSLLHGGQLERFCAKHLPETFSQLRLPFAAVAAAVPERRAVTITDGHLASAISASCSIPYLRRPVEREDQYLIDGGVACIMPSATCRELGAEFVIASDVWEYSSLLRTLGCHPSHPRHSRFYPQNYRVAVHDTDLHIHPSIPLRGYVPDITAIERMITAGEDAARRALAHLLDKAPMSTVQPETVPDQNVLASGR